MFAKEKTNKIIILILPLYNITYYMYQYTHTWNYDNYIFVTFFFGRGQEYNQIFFTSKIWLRTKLSLSLPHNLMEVGLQACCARITWCIVQLSLAAPAELWRANQNMVRIVSTWRQSSQRFPPFLITICKNSQLFWQLLCRETRNRHSSPSQVLALLCPPWEALPAEREAVEIARGRQKGPLWETLSSLLAPTRAAAAQVGGRRVEWRTINACLWSTSSAFPVSSSSKSCTPTSGAACATPGTPAQQSTVVAGR